MGKGEYVNIVPLQQVIDQMKPDKTRCAGDCDGLHVNSGQK
jgi:hypothetical protein